MGVIGYYRNGWKAVRRHTWFLFIPLALTFVSQLFIAKGEMRSLFRQESPGPGFDPAALTLRFDLPLQLLKGIHEALQSVKITWHGINLWYFSLALILLYYIFFMTDAKKFRSFFFEIRSPKDAIVVTHWSGLLLFAAGGIATILKLLKIPFLQNLSARLPFLDIPVVSLVMFLGLLPFTAFLTAFALKLIKKILVPGSPTRKWQIQRSSFFGLAAFLLIIYLFSNLGSLLWKYLGRPWIIPSENSIFHRLLFNEFYSLACALVVLVFIFTPVVMVFRQEPLLQSLKHGAVFFFKNLAPVMGLLAPALLILIILVVSGSYIFQVLVFSAPSLSHRMLFYLTEVIIPCVQVIVQTAIALALASLWFSRNPDPA